LNNFKIYIALNVSPRKALIPFTFVRIGYETMALTLIGFGLIPSGVTI